MDVALNKEILMKKVLDTWIEWKKKKDTKINIKKKS